MVRQNKSGPKGSPCWTTSEELMTFSPQNSEDGEEYAELTKLKISGANFWTASSILSLRMELKALEKSSFTMASLGLRMFRNILDAWTAASAPILTPKPNWRGARSTPISFITLWLATLAARRRRVHPTVIGLTPPFSFCRAHKLAPKKKGRMKVGVFPSSTSWMKAARAERTSCLLLMLEGPIMSFKC